MLQIVLIYTRPVAVAGGFARVYRAALDGHPVALKCLLAQHANEQHTGKLRPAA